MSSGSFPLGRWGALDAMRGLAALLVVPYHLRWNWHGYGIVPVRHGFYAVDVFFVLSGFVMAATYGDLRIPSDLIASPLGASLARWPDDPMRLEDVTVYNALSRSVPGTGKGQLLRGDSQT